MPGYWEPHTSSVDFCEPNYFLTNYIAEPHNVWSSLFITYVAIIGMLNGNPSKEWCIFTMYAVLASVGLGSAGLHTSLHWLLQSSDEVPMLWVVLSMVYILWLHRSHAKDKKESAIPGFLFLALGTIQTILYYTFQEIYAVFLASFALYVTLIIVWAHLVIQATPKGPQRDTRLFIHWRSFTLFVLVGFSLWVIDMNFCSSLMPYYKVLTGFTLHVFWHVFAGLSSCYSACNLTMMRMQDVKGLDVELHFVHGFIPVCRLANNSKASNGSTSSKSRSQKEERKES